MTLPFFYTVQIDSNLFKTLGAFWPLPRCSFQGLSHSTIPVFLHFRRIIGVFTPYAALAHSSHYLGTGGSEGITPNCIEGRLTRPGVSRAETRRRPVMNIINNFAGYIHKANAAAATAGAAAVAVYAAAALAHAFYSAYASYRCQRVAAK